MWGTGASSTQCEGAAPASDWWDWEREGRAPVSGDGNGFADRFADDFAALAELGLTHHRLSLEWARLEPEEGRHDDAAVSHYRDVLLSARDAGVTPWVCLHHFTLPRWFARLGGFLVERNRAIYWRRHVDFVAETFGDLVGGWQPVNETNYYATVAYGGLGWPPGHRDSDERALAAENIHLATAEAALALRATGAPVASIFGLSCEVALDDRPESAATVAALQAVNWEAGIGLFRDGVLRVAGRHTDRAPGPGRLFRPPRVLLLRDHGGGGGQGGPVPRRRRPFAARVRDRPRGAGPGAVPSPRAAAGNTATGRRVRRRYR